jgi:hypothetical protein
MYTPTRFRNGRCAGVFGKEKAEPKSKIGCYFEIYNSRRPYSSMGGTDARPGILPPSARSCGGVTRNEEGGGNVKIDETDFNISTARTTTEQVFT